MRRFSRRSVVAAGSALAFAGCLGRDSDDDGTTAPEAGGGLPDDLERALESIPSRAGEQTLDRLEIVDISNVDGADVRLTPLLLGPSDVEYQVTATYSDDGYLRSLTGPFTTDDLAEPDDSGSETTYRADGRYTSAYYGGESWNETAIDAVRAALDDASTGFLSDDLAIETIDPVADGPKLIVNLDPDPDEPTDIDGLDPEDVEYAAGMETAGDDTIQSMVLGFEDASSVPDAVPAGTSIYGKIVESSERRGRLLVFEFEVSTTTAATEDHPPVTTFDVTTTDAVEESTDVDPRLDDEEPIYE